MPDHEHPTILRFSDYAATASDQAILLTCYMTGAENGANLGTAGYSYDMVAKIFWPLLERWGEVIPVPDPERNLDRAADAARARGLKPVHVSFLPFQDVHLAKTAPNIVVPAWEFPDIPNHVFDDNPRNDWTHVANQCDAVFVGGDFTKNAFQSGGINVPVHIVPVPTPSEYFALPAPDCSVRRELACKIYDPRRMTDSGIAITQRQRPRWQEVGRALEGVVRNATSAIIPRERLRRLAAPLQNRWDKSVKQRRKDAPRQFTLPFRYQTSLDPAGVVYTSIFNPSDGRKNWVDLLTAFQTALAEFDDATLVVKLITNRPLEVMKVINYYINRDLPHRCRILFISDFLSHEQMVGLAEASSYYIQTTKAEGNCLPLMNFLAAGRPGISPRHTAIQDYFGSDMGYVVESHPEPAAWPHDKRLRLRTTWHRLVWQSLVDQIRQSYHDAKSGEKKYLSMSNRCREKMRSWAHETAVGSRLDHALRATLGSQGQLAQQGQLAHSAQAFPRAA